MLVLEWNDIEFSKVTVTDPITKTKFDEYVCDVDFNRGKRTDAPLVEKKRIRGKLEIKRIMQYIDKFEVTKRHGRFFRYLDKTGKIGTQKQIGENPTRNWGKMIAKMLDLPNPERFTSHWVKRQSITNMFNKGLTVAEVQGQTHHKSQKVLSEYNAASEPALNKVAAALAIDGLQDTEVWNEQQRTSTSSSALTTINKDDEMEAFQEWKRQRIGNSTAPPSCPPSGSIASTSDSPISTYHKLHISIW